MKSTYEEPTNFESSETLYTWLRAKHRVTQKSFAEKKGKGIFFREFHWATRADIPLLAATAEVETLKDENSKPCTEKSHLFYEDKEVDHIKCREYACLTCPECMKLQFHKCVLGWKRVGVTHRCQIRMKASYRDSERFTASAGLRMAADLQAGCIIGAECANTTEPYIIANTLSALQENLDGVRCHWMGAIEPGMPYIECKKYRRNSEHNYSEIEYKFMLAAEDLRIIFMKHKHIQPSRSSSRVSTPQHDIVQLDEAEVIALQLRTRSAGSSSHA